MKYKVISDWPGRRDFEVGQIVVLDKDFATGYKMFEVEDCQGKRQYIAAFFDMFPMQFKKIVDHETEEIDYTDTEQLAKDVWLFLTDDSMPEKATIKKEAAIHEIKAMIESAILFNQKK